MATAQQPMNALLTNIDAGVDSSLVSDNTVPTGKPTNGKAKRKSKFSGGHSPLSSLSPPGRKSKLLGKLRSRNRKANKEKIGKGREGESPTKPDDRDEEEKVSSTSEN